MDALRLSELRLSEDSIEAKGGSGDADIDFEEDPTGGQVEEDHIAEKKRDNQNVEGQCVIEPQKRALAIIQTPDHDPPTRWFDNDTDAAAFVTAVGKANDVAANVVGERNTSRVLYRFLSTVFELRYLRKEEKDEEFPRLSLQERRNRHLQAVIEASAFARDFGPHLARHVTLMLLCTRRSLKKPQKGPNGSSDVSEMIDKLLLWFEQNDAADMDHFERLHPWLKNLGAHTAAKTRRNGRYQGKWADKKKRRSGRRGRGPSLAGLPEKKRFETRSPIPLSRPDQDIDLPIRPVNESQGERRWSAH